MSIEEYIEKILGSNRFEITVLQGGVSRRNYLIQMEDGQKFVLHLTRSTLQLYQQAASEFQAYLSTQKFPVAQTISELEYIDELEGAAEICSFIDGVHLPYFQTQHAHALGVLLARLHECSSKMPSSAVLTELVREERRWKLMPAAYWKHHTLGICAWFKAFICKRTRLSPCFLLRGFLDQWRLRKVLRELPQGFCHGDLHGNNLLWSTVDDGAANEISGLLDFEKVGLRAYISDIADAVSRSAGLSESCGEFSAENLESLLAGYCSLRDLTEDERRVLPVLIACRSREILWKEVLNWHRGNPARDTLVEYAYTLTEQMRIGSCSG